MRRPRSAGAASQKPSGRHTAEHKCKGRWVLFRACKDLLKDSDRDALHPAKRRLLSAPGQQQVDFEIDSIGDSHRSRRVDERKGRRLPQSR